jgi:hypothetical protein
MVRPSDIATHGLMRLLGVRLVSDLYERACDLGVPPPLDAKRRAWLVAIEARKLLFVHIPKAAGMSISRALYDQHVTHCTIRYYARIAPRLVLKAPSFAIVRDPVERFLSAYAYARAGGGDNRVSPAFRARYAAFRSLDEALDHVEAARTVYRMDHIFRPQTWFVSDAAGRIAVDTLVPFTALDRIGALVPGFPEAALPHLNRSEPITILPTLDQLERIRLLYAKDFALVDVAAERAGIR